MTSEVVPSHLPLAPGGPLDTADHALAGEIEDDAVAAPVFHVDEDLVDDQKEFSDVKEQQHASSQRTVLTPASPVQEEVKVSAATETPTPVVIKTLDGQRLSLLLNVAAVSVGQLRITLAKLMKQKPDDVRLICKGQPLLDDWTLERCGVRGGDLIHALRTMRGS
jgi:hypothetical protein